jgi:hypothetical protein
MTDTLQPRRTAPPQVHRGRVPRLSRPDVFEPPSA